MVTPLKVVLVFLGVFLLNTLLACDNPHEKIQIGSKGTTKKIDQNPQDTFAEEANSQIKRKGYTATKYPVVLVHGMLGCASILGISDYFYKIPSDLRKGNTEVYIAKVGALASSEGRGEELLKQVEDILAKARTLAKKDVSLSHQSTRNRNFRVKI